MISPVANVYRQFFSPVNSGLGDIKVLSHMQSIPEMFKNISSLRSCVKESRNYVPQISHLKTL